MGEVWSGYDEVLNRVVAVKVIRPHLADDATVRERLRIEAQLAGSLHHPNIVDIFDYGQDEAEGRTTPFLVMPLIDGIALSQLLKSRAALTVGETMAIIAEMASALEAAHTAGIVHRDLKPANVLLAPSSRVMLVDFGIARSIEGDSLTQTGALIGTADYLSPEQSSGHSATYASDLYALGIVAYTCLTGAPPFHRETDIATALAHIQAPMPDLPEELVAQGISPLIERLLAKEPSDRPGSAGEVAAIAATFATAVPAVISSAAPDRTLPSVASPATGTMSDQTVAVEPPVESTAVFSSAVTELATRESRRPRRGVLFSSAVLALVAVAFAMMFAGGSGQVEVPDVRSLTSVEAVAKMTQMGLRIKSTEIDIAGHKAGEVVKQSPSPRSEVDKGTTVLVTVASGAIPIPKGLVGATYDDAAQSLEKLGLKPSRNDVISSKEAGTVIDVEPSSRAMPGEPVVLAVAVAAPRSNDSGSDGSVDSGKGNGKGKRGK